MNSPTDGRQYIDFVAQLAATGRLIDAELVLRQAADFFNRNDLLEASFYFVASAVRHDEWKRAMPLIMTSRRYLSESLSDRGLTFGWLTIALARFAIGKLRHACHAAHHAWTISERSEFKIEKCLVGEILAPATIMTGHVAQGFLILDQTIRLTKDLRRTASLEHLLMQRELLRARYTDQPSIAIRRLKKIAARTDNIGNRASLFLECCRLESIMGNISNARFFWRQAAELLQNSPPRRTIFALRSRLAMISLAAGDSHEALVIAASALQIMDQRRDLIARLELLEIIVAAQRILRKSHQSTSFETDLLRLQSITGFRAPQSSTDPINQTLNKTDLNHRQIQLLSQLTDDSYIDIRTYVLKHGVSEVTAFRDLSALVRAGYLMRTGKARATRYSRSN